MSAVQDPSPQESIESVAPSPQREHHKQHQAFAAFRLPKIENILNNLAVETGSLLPHTSGIDGPAETGTTMKSGSAKGSALLDLPSSFSQYSMLSPLYGSGNLGHVFVLPPPVSSLQSVYYTSAAAGDSQKSSTSSVASPKSSVESESKPSAFEHPNKRLNSIVDQLQLQSKDQQTAMYDRNVHNGGYSHLAPSYHQPNHISINHHYPYGYLDNYYQTAYRQSVSNEITISNEELQLRKFQPYNKKRRASDSSSTANQTNNNDAGGVASTSAAASLSRSSRVKPPATCHSCNTTETPEWRRGPDGARTLCNACGLHYAKLLKKRKSALDLTSRAPSAHTNNPVRLLSIAATSSLKNIVNSYPAPPLDVTASQSNPSINNDQDQTKQ